MSTPTVPIIDIQRYVAAVRQSLADLPPEDVDDLTQGMEADLAELIDESPTDLATRLGTPEEYAAELRSAAGLPAFAASGKGWRQSESRIQAWIGSFPTRHAGLARLAKDLAPAWWFVRGFAIGVFLGRITFFWSPLMLLVTGLLGAAGSIWLARRLGDDSRRAPGFAPLSVLISTIGVILIGFWALAGVYVFADRSVGGYDGPNFVSGLAFNGAPVSQIYVYDEQGRRLENVRVFSDQGEPLVLNEDMTGTGGATWLDSGGRSWQNVYPAETQAGLGWQVMPNSGWWVPPMSIDALTVRVPEPVVPKEDSTMANPNAPTQAVTTPATPSDSSTTSSTSSSTVPSSTSTKGSSGSSTKPSSSGSSSKSKPSATSTK